MHNCNLTEKSFSDIASRPLEENRGTAGNGNGCLTPAIQTEEESGGIVAWHTPSAVVA
jgi:hypothetical protein